MSCKAIAKDDFATASPSFRHRFTAAEAAILPLLRNRFATALPLFRHCFATPLLSFCY
jgi:hypothetical protein